MERSYPVDLAEAGVWSAIRSTFVAFCTFSYRVTLNTLSRFIGWWPSSWTRLQSGGAQRQETVEGSTIVADVVSGDAGPDLRSEARVELAASEVSFDHSRAPPEPPRSVMAEKSVYALSIVDLPRTIVNPSLLATPCRLRLLDVSAYLDTNELRIVEYDDPGLGNSQAPTADFERLPPYAAISYPWRDLQLDDGVSIPSFAVAGAEHADPISIDVLRTACVASRRYGYSRLWLDRLCLLQNDKTDKIWQIQHMFRIYQNCSVCLVFPGGLVRLARLDDDTAWIHRAWTLQEAVAPGLEKLRLVFQLTHPSYRSFIEHCCDTEGYGHEVRDLLFKSSEFPQYGDLVDEFLEESRSASCSMVKLLVKLWSLDIDLRRLASDMAGTHITCPIRVLPVAEAHLLENAISLRGMRLWIAAYTRSSSRPVDMVFSLMDLLGVQIDVKQFHKDDRTRATISMIQAIMRRPKAKATWLFINPTMTPSRELSTLPEMPETSESGRAFIQTPTGRIPAFKAAPADGSNFWRFDGAPSGDMMDSGYFVFSAKGALMSTPLGSSPTHDMEETWAVIVGRFKNFNRNPITWKPQTWNPDKAPRPSGLFELTLMLIERHGDNQYHRVGMERWIDERQTANWNWIERQFCVGGPGKGPRRRFGVAPSGPVYLENAPKEEDETFIFLE